MDSTPRSFATILRAFRTAANLTQEELAERSGLSVNAISALERGLRRAPRTSTVSYLAEAMGLDPAQRAALVAAARGPAEPEAAATHRTDEPSSTLPRSVADFTGRAAEVERLRTLLELEHPTAPPAVVVTGAAGAGKTTLALHVAHLLRGRFPDGQLFVDLRGAEDGGLGPREVLTTFLQGLGLHGGALPSDLPALLMLYRARLVDRRILVVLDNAADEAQVRPLLPSGSGCAALVTSRAPLAGLEGVSQLPLEVLSRTEALRLLARVAGERRVAAEPEAAAEVVRLVGHLPLAVRIAGARLAARPRWQMRTYAERLADERVRLDELRVGDLEVRASLALSYRALGGQARRCVRLLGVLDAPDFPGWLVAGLLAVPARDAEDLLERLVDARLVETSGQDRAGQLRYRLHSLVRLFARELLAEDDPAAVRSALERALGAQLALADVAKETLSPAAVARVPRGSALRWQPAGSRVVEAVRRDPLAWYEAERASLVAGVVQGSREGFDDFAWELACNLSTFFGIRGYREDWRTTHEQAVHATRLAGNRPGEMRVSRPLGESYLWTGDYDGAEPWLQSSLDLARELGDARQEHTLVNSLGFLAVGRGQPARARGLFERAIAYCRPAGDWSGEAIALIGRGQALRSEGRLDEAVESLSASCARFAAAGERFWEAVAQFELAHALRLADRREEAEECLVRSIGLSDAVGSRHYSAFGRYRLVTLGLDRWTPCEAVARLEECVEALRRLGLAEAVGATRRIESLRAAACR